VSECVFGTCKHVQRLERELCEAKDCLKDVLTWFAPYFEKVKRWRRAAGLDTANASLVGNSAEDAAREKWNAEADEYNQWDSLGQDEKDLLIVNNNSSLGT